MYVRILAFLYTYLCIGKCNEASVNKAKPITTIKHHLPRVTYTPCCAHSRPTADLKWKYKQPCMHTDTLIHDVYITLRVFSWLYNVVGNASATFYIYLLIGLLIAWPHQLASRYAIVIKAGGTQAMQNNEKITLNLPGLFEN